MNNEYIFDEIEEPSPASVRPRRGVALLMFGMAILFVIVVYGSIQTVRGIRDAQRGRGGPADILVELRADHLTRCEMGERVVVFQLAPGTYSVRCAIGR